MRLADLSERDVARFWSKVDRRGDDECWDWTGAVNDDGYGYISISGKPHGAHRVALIVSGVTLDGGLQALHSCDRPPCCNPAHLRAGTRFENFRDARSRGRLCTGERAAQSVLTEHGVLEIRRRLATGETIAAIAASLGVKRITAYFAASRRSWKHLP